MVTMLDVSRKVGVSKSTVSKVLNGKGRVSEKTRQAILKAIKELDYRPNILAQSLSNQKSNTIGLIIPQGYSKSQYINELTRVVQEMADKAGKLLIITQVDSHQITSGIESIHSLVDRRCDGILYYKSSYIGLSSDQQRLETLVDELPIPLILLNTLLPDKKDHCVWIDQEYNARISVDYLLSQGHKRIAYITGNLDMNTPRQRLQAYNQALTSAGITLDPLLVAQSSGDFRGGYQGAMQLLQREVNFSAICCFNDATAIGALKALQENNIEVPEQVSLIGFDNEDASEFVTPSITTVDMPVKALVNYAGELLFGHMNLGVPPTINHYGLKAALVIRDSVKLLN